MNKKNRHEEFRIGFIGLGEVGVTFAQALADNGARVSGYDIILEQIDGKRRLKEKLANSNISIDSLGDVIRSSDYVISLVPTKESIRVAQECAQYLHPGQVYVDMNSTSPEVKIEIEKIITSAGGIFVEAAILGAVGATGRKTRIITTGDLGEKVAMSLTEKGMNVHFFGQAIGMASNFKMVRSIFSKGIECLLLETLIAAKRSGISEEIWEDISDFMASKPFDVIAKNWITTHSVAYQRRYDEVVQVLETMDDLHLEAVMTKGTLKFFNRSLRLGLDVEFTEKPSNLFEVTDWMESVLK